MFKDTVRNNIVYGNRYATERQIEEAARSANVMDVIEHLPTPEVDRRKDRRS